MKLFMLISTIDVPLRKSDMHMLVLYDYDYDYYYHYYHLYAEYLHYIPETNHVSRVYTVAAVLYL
jgi:hypothetical protein